MYASRSKLSNKKLNSHSKTSYIRKTNNEINKEIEEKKKMILEKTKRIFQNSESTEKFNEEDFYYVGNKDKNYFKPITSNSKIFYIRKSHNEIKKEREEKRKIIIEKATRIFKNLNSKETLNEEEIYYLGNQNKKLFKPIISDSNTIYIRKMNNEIKKERKEENEKRKKIYENLDYIRELNKEQFYYLYNKDKKLFKPIISDSNTIYIRKNRNEIREEEEEKKKMIFEKTKRIFQNPESTEKFNEEDFFYVGSINKKYFKPITYNSKIFYIRKSHNDIKKEIEEEQRRLYQERKRQEERRREEEEEEEEEEQRRREEREKRNKEKNRQFKKKYGYNPYY